MLKEYAHEYVKLGIWINEYSGRLYLATDEPDDPGRPLNDTELKELKQFITQLLNTCIRLGLKAAVMSLQRAIADPPKTNREFEIYIGVLMDELKNQLFLFVPAERSDLYQAALNISGFPSAEVEMIHSGNCFALGEYTACVFHAMRAVEVGLDAVRVNLGLSARNVNERSWGNICNDIKTGISGKGKTWIKVDEYTAIYATLVSLKDAWRNQTMHVAATYDDTEARMILENTKHFIARLSAKMDEKGLPLA